MPVATISDDSFDSEVLAANKPVIVDFWAEWCGPCKQVSAHFEALADELGDKVKVVTQEGGARAGARAITGWVPAASLAPLDRFPDNTSTYGLCGAPTAVSETAKYQSCDRATSRLR